MATYDEMARDVMNWANRSTDVLDYERIKQCLVFAHDEIYRTCRIASMEGRFSYDPIDETQATSGALTIPSNAVEFIQLRKRFQDGTADNAFASNRYIVAEARNDIRSFYGDATSRYSNFSYSREYDQLLVYPKLTEEELWELYYYYRFEDPHDRLALNDDNIQLGLFTKTIDTFNSNNESLKTGIFETDPTLVPHIYKTENADDIDDAIASYASDPDNNFTVAVGDQIVGELEVNWFRDANEKALLFGGLHQAFDYLDEQDQSAKYKGKFEQEIAKLNAEEQRRQVMGGNVQTNFYSILI